MKCALYVDIDSLALQDDFDGSLMLLLYLPWCQTCREEKSQSNSQFSIWYFNFRKNVLILFLTAINPFDFNGPVAFVLSKSFRNIFSTIVHKKVAWPKLWDGRWADCNYCLHSILIWRDYLLTQSNCQETSGEFRILLELFCIPESEIWCFPRYYYGCNR